MIFARIIGLIAVCFATLGGASVEALACGSGRNTCEPNGCGPNGRWGRLVPNEVWGLCDFKEACNAHDLCYARCSPCGDLHGCPTCNKPKGSPEREARKVKCDAQLRKDIARINQRRLIPGLCSAFGRTYEFAVGNAGGPYFNGYKLPSELANRIRGEFSALQALAKLDKEQPGIVNWATVTSKLSVRNGEGLGSNKFLTLDAGQATPEVRMRDFESGKSLDVSSSVLNIRARGGGIGHGRRGTPSTPGTLRRDDERLRENGNRLPGGAGGGASMPGR